MARGCPDYCTATPDDKACKKNEPKPNIDDCQTNPEKEGCPNYCKINYSFPVCKPPTPKICEKKPDTMGCPKFCELF